MSLLMDAMGYDVPKAVLNFSILRQIEDDLDIDERISILFLIVEDYTDAFGCIFNLYQKARTKDAHILLDYVKSHPNDWENRVLEALSIINNREVIGRLRVSYDDLDVYYVPRFNSCAKNVNVIAKCLYKVCESLDEHEEKLLIGRVRSENSDYEPLLDDVDYLELHMLYWMQIKYITISKGMYDLLFNRKQ